MKKNPPQTAIMAYFNAYPNIHPCAEEIYMFVKKQRPSIGIATIYRNLHKLVKEGCIAELNIEKQGVRYDLLSHEHYHFICEKCQHIKNFTLPALQTIDRDIEAIVKGKILTKSMTFRGICEECNHEL